MTRIVAVCGQRGSAANLAPVVRRGRDAAGWEVKVFAYGEAGPAFRGAGLGYEAVEPNLTVGDAATLLSGWGAAAVLGGTDAWRHVEKRFVRAAARLRLPAVLFVDYWANYAQRFIDEDGVLCVPDRVAVLDSEMRDGVCRLGIPRENVAVTGAPALEHAARAIRSRIGSEAGRLRMSAGIGPGDTCVLFVSLPFSDLDCGPLAGGAHRHSLLPTIADVIACLALHSRRAGSKCHLLIRPHPREDASAFSNIVAEGVNVRINTDDDPSAWIAAADLVVGLDSMLMLEAAQAGRPVLCLAFVRELNPTMLRLLAKAGAVVRRPEDLANELEVSLVGLSRKSRFAALPESAELSFGATEGLVEVVNGCALQGGQFVDAGTAV